MKILSSLVFLLATLSSSALTYAESHSNSFESFGLWPFWPYDEQNSKSEGTIDFSSQIVGSTPIYAESMSDLLTEMIILPNPNAFESFKAQLEDESFNKQEFENVLDALSLVGTAIDVSLLDSMAGQNILKMPEAVSLVTNFESLGRGRGIFHYSVVQTITLPECEGSAASCNVDISLSIALAFPTEGPRIYKSSNSNYMLEFTDMHINISEFDASNAHVSVHVDSKVDALIIDLLEIEVLVDENNEIAGGVVEIEGLTVQATGTVVNNSLTLNSSVDGVIGSVVLDVMLRAPVSGVLEAADIQMTTTADCVSGNCDTEASAWDRFFHHWPGKNQWQKTYWF